MELRRLDFERTRDHWWWRPGWGPGARFLTFHLTFETAPELHAEAARLAPGLEALPRVDVVPIPWLHLTMTGVGFVEDVRADQLAALTDAVIHRAEGMATSPLVFDGIVLAAEGTSLTASATPWLHELKALQKRAVAEICGVSDAGVFRPHVSLAYFAGDVDSAAVVEVVSDARDITVARPLLSLIELGRDDGVYTWRVLAQSSL